MSGTVDKGIETVSIIQPKLLSDSKSVMILSSIITESLVIQILIIVLLVPTMKIV